MASAAISKLFRLIRAKVTRPDSSKAINVKFDIAYLHVGYDKTGSTAIQNVCCLAPEALARQSIIYPMGPGSDRNHRRLGSCFSSDPTRNGVNRNTGRSISGEETIRREDKEWLAGFSQCLTTSKGRVLVLSFEGFITLELEELARIKTYLEQFANRVKVIVYCREAVSFAASAVSQRAKMRRPWGFLEIRNHEKDIRKLVSVFGRKDVIVRLFDRSMLLDGDVRMDFLVTAGLTRSEAKRTLEEVSTDDPGFNKSLSVHGIGVAEALRELEDELGLPAEEKLESIFQHRYAGLLSSIQGPNFCLTSDEKKALLALPVVQRSVSYLRNEFDLEFAQQRERPESDVRELFDACRQSGIYRAMAKLFVDMGWVQPGSPEGFVSADMEVVRAEPGESLKFNIVIENTGMTDWWTNPRWPLKGGYYWLSSTEHRIGEERFELPGGKVLKGQKVMIDLTVIAPDEAGEHELVISLVQENMRWFDSSTAFKPARVEVLIDTIPHVAN